MLIPVARLVGLGVAPSLVLHVGGHTGEEAAAYAEAGWPAVWVESQPDLCERMAADGLDVRCATIWSTSHEATFHVTSNGQSSSLLPLARHLSYYPHIVEVEARTVTTTTIDALGLHPDMLNLDIQGAELEALIGGNRTLQNVRWVYTEVSSEPLYEGGVLEPELTGYLSDAGFVKVVEEWTGYGWGDALYARNVTEVPGG
jgi:FkbM family methyltransferase